MRKVAPKHLASLERELPLRLSRSLQRRREATPNWTESQPWQPMSGNSR